MTDYNPDSFASIMRTIYHEQVARYETNNINPHPRAYQEQVKLRAKINKVYALKTHTYGINEIAEVIY